MYKIFIVDDEQAVRIGMRSMIDWKKHGFEVAGEAKDGKSAFTLIRETHPDIVITDLEMPEMDGVELIKQLFAGGFRGKILVLSNYDEFELVRSAMKAGASDYLLKVTIEPSELLDYLHQLCEELKCERARMEENESIQQKLFRSRDIELRQFLLELVGGTLSDPAACLDTATSLGLPADRGGKQLIYAVIDHYDEKIKSGQLKDRRLCAQTLVTAMSEAVPHPGVYALDVNFREFALLSLHGGNRITPEAVSRIKGTVNLYLNLSVTVVVSREFETLNDISARFEGCRQAAQYRFYCGAGATLSEDSVSLSDDMLRLGQEHIAAKIKKFIETNDKAAVAELFDTVVEQAEEVKLRPALLQSTINAMLDNLNSQLLNYNAGELFDLSEYKSLLAWAETAGEFRQGLAALIDAFFARLQKFKYEKYRKPIDQVVKFIDEHLCQRISLTDISQAFNISEGYLCKLFKSETGKTLVQYINCLKATYAAELMKDSEIMVREVSMAVGIEDQFYFNRMFKKYMGVSPLEYKKKVTEDSKHPEP